MMVVPSRGPSLSARMRSVTSDTEPAANGSTMRMGRDGYLPCASTGADTAINAATASGSAVSLQPPIQSSRTLYCCSALLFCDHAVAQHADSADLDLDGVARLD